MQLQRALQAQWNKCIFLPQLKTLLQFLQGFIIHTNWKQLSCSQIEMKRIQSNLNNLLSLIEGQKLYGRQYWSSSERRVQASVVHYFIYLKMLILAIIPDSCQNMSQALLHKKLCVQITKIEDLINNFLTNLKPLYAFLHGDKFLEQQSLTNELFQSITKFWQKLPRMTKRQLQQVPKIMRYICLNNPLDPVPLDYQSSKLYQLRKKSETLQGGKEYRTDKRYETCFDRKSNNLQSKQNVYQRKLYDSSGKTESKGLPEDKTEKKVFFKFKKYVFENMNNNTVTEKIEKSSTIISCETIQNRLSPGKLDRLRSTTFIPQNFSPEQKSKKDSRLTIQKPRFDVKNRDRLVTKSGNSDLSLQKYKLMLQKCEQQEIERKILKKTKGGKFKIQFNTISDLVHLQTGRVKGWALIRQNITQNIVVSKLKKLHQS